MFVPLLNAWHFGRLGKCSAALMCINLSCMLYMLSSVQLFLTGLEHKEPSSARPACCTEAGGACPPEGLKSMLTLCCSVKLAPWKETALTFALSSSMRIFAGSVFVNGPA